MRPEVPISAADGSYRAMDRYVSCGPVALVASNAYCTRALVGSSKAAPEVGALFDRYSPMVYRRAMRILGNHEDAEEATNEVFIRALKNSERFEDRSSVSTWLYSITTNYCLNKLRDRKRRQELWEQNVAPQAATSTSTNPDKLMLVRRLIRDADPQQATAALHVHVDGMSHAEAAKVLGVSRRTIGNLLERFAAWARTQTDEDQP